MGINICPPNIRQPAIINPVQEIKSPHVERTGINMMVTG